MTRERRRDVIVFAVAIALMLLAGFLSSKLFDAGSDAIGTGPVAYAHVGSDA